VDTYSVSKRIALFPETARLATLGGREGLRVADCDLEELAAQYGTPLYVYDQATMDAALDRYRRALARHYPGEAGITYAGKAFLCTAVGQWVRWRGLWLDCTGVGELHIAEAAGVERDRIVVHGVNKSEADLTAAAAHAGVVVVDNLQELERWAGLKREASSGRPALWLRLRPGQAVETHAFTQTGQESSKFGMAVPEIAEAVRVCQAHGLRLTGLHFHQGSHFRDPAPLGTALDITLDLMVQLQRDHGWLPEVLSPGGGWGVAYHEDELPHPPFDAYVEFLSAHLVAGCSQRGLPLPQLQLEPGRSLVARAGVALYRVGAVKHTTGRRWVLLDGGLADNPRPALYGARYSALPVVEPRRSPSGTAWLAGPYCETGDVLIARLALPDVQPGELMAVPVSGAYQLSMGSNYNGARKPAVLWLQAGTAHLVQRREQLEDLARRDQPLPPGQGRGAPD
jgi:diaminopimelate decarboxylase